MSKFDILQDIKKLSRTGLFIVNKKSAATNFAFFQAVNQDQSKFAEFFSMGENELLSKHLPKLLNSNVLTH